jgi:CDP-diacylglycerol--glycerol-3-phosphate 3-phosphatidyltransferase
LIPAGQPDRRAPKLRPLREELTDLPNLITLGRVAMIPLILIFVDDFSPALSALSAALFAIASVTDALDGYLARRLGLVTVVGTFLDPLADKLIVLSTLVTLVARDRAPAWLVIVLMSRELAVTGLRAIASQRGFVIAAGAGGKAKTALQLVGILFLLIHFRYPLIGLDYRLDFHQVGTVVLYVSLILSVTSAVEYFSFFAAAAQQQADELAAQGITRAQRKTELRDERKARRLAIRARKRAKREKRRERIRQQRERRRNRSERRRPPKDG